MNVQLVHDLLPVLLDGLDADAEFRGDLLVREAFRNELQHLRLARSQLARLLDAAGRW